MLCGLCGALLKGPFPELFFFPTAWKTLLYFAVISAWKSQAVVH